MSEQLNCQQNTALINPALLTERGLKPNALQILYTARERKQISTQEIVKFLPGCVIQNREEFVGTIQWLGAFLKTIGILIVTGKQEIAHKQQFPIESLSYIKPWRRNKIASQIAFVENDGDLEDVTDSIFGNDDILYLYRKEVKQFPLLSKEEEQALAKRVREDRDLEARDELIKRNLRLVFWVAKRYLWSEFEYADLVQEGSTGLIIAVERFDYRRGFRFSSYAIWWIRQAISRAIMNTKGMLRLPVHIWELRYRILKASADLASQLGYPPTDEEIAKQSKEPVSVVRRVLTRLNFEIISLDDVISHEAKENGIERYETLGDEAALDPIIVMEAKDELKQSRRNIATLLKALSSFEADFASPRNQEIFKAIYGLDGPHIHQTLETVGQQFAITRERVRQIVARIWYELDAAGVDMDHDSLLQELYRIGKLEELVDYR